MLVLRVGIGMNEAVLQVKKDGGEWEQVQHAPWLSHVDSHYHGLDRFL